MRVSYCVFCVWVIVSSITLLIDCRLNHTQPTNQFELAKPKLVDRNSSPSSGRKGKYQRNFREVPLTWGYLPNGVKSRLPVQGGTRIAS